MSPMSKGQKGSLKYGWVWFASVVTEATTIRQARREDVPTILAIYNAAVLEPSSAYEDVPHTLAQREEWFEQFMRRNFPVVVAEHGGMVVGRGSLRPHQEAHRFSIHRHGGAVRSQHISSSWYRRAIARGTAGGWTRTEDSRCCLRD